MREDSDRRYVAVLWVFVAVMAILVVLRTRLPTGVFWITDAGNKFIVAQNFAIGDYRHVAIGYPAADLDPAFRWFPAGGEHFVPLGRTFVSIVPFPFPLLNAPLVGMFGAAGATILPLVFGGGLLLIVIALARERRINPQLAIVAVAFATPIAFYSLDFWEHTAAAFFAALSVFLLSRQRSFLAGVACAMSIAMREEGYVLFIALVIALATMRRAREAGLLTAGVSLIIVPLLCAQRSIYGTFLGVHLASHAGAPTLARLAGNVAYFLFQFHERTTVAAALAIPSVFAICVGAMRQSAPRLRCAAVAGMVIGSAIGVGLILSNHDPIVNTMTTQGLFLFLPFTGFALVRWRALLDGDFVARTLLIFVVLMPLVLHVNWTGIIWGPRYFLTIIPLLTLVSIGSAESKTLLAVALAVGIVLEVDGLVLLQRKLAATADLRSLLEREQHVVMTDVFWLPEEMGSLFFEKRFLMPESVPETRNALSALAGHGVRDFVFITSSTYHGSGAAVIRPYVVRRIRFVSSAVPLLDVDVLECRIPPLPSR